MGATYLVIKQICSQLVCSMATKAQNVRIISPNARLFVNFLAHGWLQPCFKSKEKVLPSLGKETEILHNKSVAYIDLSGVVLVLSNLSSPVQSEIRCICMSLQEYRSTPFKKTQKAQLSSVNYSGLHLLQ